MALGFACMAGQAVAQQATTGQSFDALSARLEQQDQQIRQLQAQVSGMQQQGVNATPVSYDMAGGMRSSPGWRRRNAPRWAAT